ncbi:uncharacterized protein LOC135370813 [Ornithodoros turicata]|uniref:uncharacterized protein LOC135370813 n=1 Tax=Ornithodoros turicata TaxID=34597 RepID=UPI0031388D85
MRFTVIITTLVAGVLVEGTKKGTTELDYVAFPCFQLALHGRGNVTFSKGKAEGLNDVIKSVSGCLGHYNCAVSVNGLRVTYTATAYAPEEVVQVRAEVTRSLVEVDRENVADGEYRMKDVRVKDMEMYIERPLQFSTVGQRTLFEVQLKKKLQEFLIHMARTDVFNRALNNVLLSRGG